MPRLRNGGKFLLGDEVIVLLGTVNDPQALQVEVIGRQAGQHDLAVLLVQLDIVDGRLGVVQVEPEGLGLLLLPAVGGRPKGIGVPLAVGSPIADVVLAVLHQPAVPAGGVQDRRILDAGHGGGSVGFAQHPQIAGVVNHVTGLVGNHFLQVVHISQQAHPGHQLTVGPPGREGQPGFVVSAGFGIHPQEVAVAGVVDVGQSGAQHILGLAGIPVEDVQRAPIPVEAQEGNAQGNAAGILRSQEGEALHIGSIGEILV